MLSNLLTALQVVRNLTLDLSGQSLSILQEEATISALLHFLPRLVPGLVVNLSLKGFLTSWKVKSDFGLRMKMRWSETAVP